MITSVFLVRFVTVAFSAAALWFFFALAMAAQTAPPTGTEDRREMRQEMRQERLDEQKKARVARHWENMDRKFDRALDRLDRIADRIESRIGKFEEKGADVAAAREKLAQTRTQIVVAKTALASAVSAVEELKNSDDPKSAFIEVRTQVQNVKKELKAARALLVEAVKVLKGASTAQEGDETPSPPPPSS